MSSKSLINRGLSGKSFEPAPKQRHNKKVELKDEFQYIKNYTDLPLYNWKLRICKKQLKIDAWMPIYDNQGKKILSKRGIEVHARHSYIPEWYYYDTSTNRIYVGLKENNPRKHLVYTGDNNRAPRKWMLSEHNRLFNENHSEDFQDWSTVKTMIRENLECASVVDYL